MIHFWARFSLFSFLWGLMIYQSSEKAAWSILFFTLSLAIYFFLSLQNASLLLYISLSLIIFFHGFLIGEHVHTLLLLFSITIVSVSKLKSQHFLSYLIINGLLSLLLGFLQAGNLLEIAILSGLSAFLLISLNNMTHDRNEQKSIYNQLLGAYRQLKRMNLSAEREARLEERTEIARTIHDSVGHRLTALIMKLEMLSIQNKDVDYRTLKRMASESLEETREAVHALQVEESEGISAVVQLIRKLEAESHILVQFTVKQGVLSVRLTGEKNVALYRVVQEALTNAMRHAISREVQVTLGKSATNAISFEIRNQVFEPKKYTVGFGLENMNERIQKVNGHLEIHQTENEFIVRGSIPSK